MLSSTRVLRRSSQVAVRTDIARRVGFAWRHHAADFAYVQAVRAELARVGLAAAKVPQTLYVHN